MVCSGCGCSADSDCSACSDEVTWAVSVVSFSCRCSSCFGEAALVVSVVSSGCRCSSCFGEAASVAFPVIRSNTFWLSGSTGSSSFGSSSSSSRSSGSNPDAADHCASPHILCSGKDAQGSVSPSLSGGSPSTGGSLPGAQTPIVALPHSPLCSPALLRMMPPPSPAAFSAQWVSLLYHHLHHSHPQVFSRLRLIRFFLFFMPVTSDWITPPDCASASVCISVPSASAL